MLFYQFLLVIYGGQETSTSHCIFIKLYRKPLGHESVVSVPLHWKYRPNLQFIGSAYKPGAGHEKYAKTKK